MIDTVQLENIKMTAALMTTSKTPLALHRHGLHQQLFPPSSVSSLSLLLPHPSNLRQATIHTLQQRLAQPMRPCPQPAEPARPATNDDLRAFARQDLLDYSIGDGLGVEDVGLCRFELVGERLEEWGCSVGRVDGGEFYRRGGVAGRCQ